MRKQIVVFLIMCLIFTCFRPISIFADVSKKSDESEKVVEISSETLDLTKKEEKQYTNFQDGMVAELKNNNIEDYNKVIKNYYKNHTDIAGEKIEEEMGDATEITNKENINIDPDIVQDLGETYQLDDSTTVEINPLYVAVETFDEGKEQNEPNILAPKDEKTFASQVKDLFISDVFAASTKSKSATAKKTYYADSGLKNFTVSLTCKFYYNGKKAWYKSGLDSYYKRHGWVSPWSVSGFKQSRESDGNSYTAKCSGKFYIQIGFKGLGFTVLDYYVKHTLTCSKTGVIKRTCKCY